MQLGYINIECGNVHAIEHVVRYAAAGYIEKIGRGDTRVVEVYYIEDDKDIAMTVKEYLEQQAYSVTVFGTLKSAEKAFESHVPDIALIDWNLPDGDGGDFCRWIRSKWKELPVIFLTVRNDTCDIVSGFQNGADDYVAKPFQLEILNSRMHAVLRRAGNVSGRYLSCGAVCLDQSRMMVFNNEEEIALSQAEYQLLMLLMKNKGRTVTRERLLEQIWDSRGTYVNDNTLTVAMKRLREKLQHPACLKTIRSFGYRMEDDV